MGIYTNLVYTSFPKIQLRPLLSTVLALFTHIADMQCSLIKQCNIYPVNVIVAQQSFFRVQRISSSLLLG